MNGASASLQAALSVNGGPSIEHELTGATVDESKAAVQRLKDQIELLEQRRDRLMKNRPVVCLAARRQAPAPRRGPVRSQADRT